MFYTHEEMKRKFGIVYFVNVLNNYRIEEHFKTDYIPFDVYPNIEIAKKAFIENNWNDEKLRDLQDIVNKYESQSFLKKLLSRKTSEFHLYSSAKKEVHKRVNNIRRKIELLESQELLKLNPKEIYKIQYPELAVGDKLYIMVVEKTSLKKEYMKESLYQQDIHSMIVKMFISLV